MRDGTGIGLWGKSKVHEKGTGRKGGGLMNIM